MADVIPLFKVHMPDDLAPLIETLRSGYVTQGPRVDEFEERIGAVLAADVLSLNSGTSALTLAYRLANVGPESIVVTTPMTCSATNLPILTAGARPIFADVDPRTGLIDLEDVERILKRGIGADAVVGVDWGGSPCDQFGLLDLGRRYGVPIIVDAAHSLGATIGHIPVGSIADMTCFSLQAIKHVTTVDGGLLAFNWRNKMHYRRGKLLRWFGIDREATLAGDSRIDVDIEQAGYKFHMNDVAATLGLLQLPHLSSIVEKHRANARWIMSRLDEYYAVSTEAWDGGAWWVLTVRLPSRKERDAFRTYMLEGGVQVSQVHRRNDDYTVFKRYAGVKELPGLDEFASRMICLPCHWALTPFDVEFILNLSNEWARRHR